MENEIEDIIINLLSSQKLTPEEQEVFEQWIKVKANQRKFHQLQQINAAIYATGVNEKIDYQKSWKQLKGKLTPRRKLTYLFPYAAAIIMIGFSIGVLILRNHPQEKTPVITTALQTDKNSKEAILILSNGQQIILSDSLLPLTEQNGSTIHNNGNQLVYQYNDTSSQLVYNTVKVPRGGEYKLTLSDGTTVWLNSESQLIYPVAFNGDTRELKLDGEAYFDVAKNKSKPFIVHTRQFDIRVTGTQFNVRTYPNEPESTTLTEGHIQLEKGNKVHPLVPGQQAVVGTHEITINQVNPEEAVAWRYGSFCFKECRLENLMNELGRWYDLEVFYLNPKLKELHFTAWFRRSNSISEVINVLERTQKIKVELKGKTLIVKAKG